MKRRASCLGFTLIELMIAMVVGLLVTAAAMALFLSSTRTHHSIDQVALLLDNARMAVNLIERDVKLAGYWGLQNDAHYITRRFGAVNALPISAVTGCAGILPTDLDQTLQVFDGASAGSCLTDYLDGTDVLVVRRAATGTPVTAPAADTLYVKSDNKYGEVFIDASVGAFGTPNETRALKVHVYYVSRTSADPGVGSSLRRLSLTTGPDYVDEELVPGVEDLQIELGMDAGGDGSVDAYVTPTAAGAAAADALAARISVLLHANAVDISYTDTEDYLALGAAAKRLPDLNRRRMQYSKTVMLRNGT